MRLAGKRANQGALPPRTAAVLLATPDQDSGLNEHPQAAPLLAARPRGLVPRAACPALCEAARALGLAQWFQPLLATNPCSEDSRARALVPRAALKAEPRLHCLSAPRFSPPYTCLGAQTCPGLCLPHCLAFCLPFSNIQRCLSRPALCLAAGSTGILQRTSGTKKEGVAGLEEIRGNQASS